jgi:hypothetical protein
MCVVIAASGLVCQDVLNSLIVSMYVHVFTYVHTWVQYVILLKSNIYIECHYYEIQIVETKNVCTLTQPTLA